MLGIGLVVGLGIGVVVARGDQPTGPTTAAPTTAAAAATLPANPTDLGFLADMLDHHQQAVEMANFAMAHADDDAVGALAATVASEQRWEMGQMEVLLADRGGTRPEGTDRTVMAWMGEPVPHDRMPGLQSKEAMLALFNSSGPDLDRRFLTMMRDHHAGGVHMAEVASTQAADPAIRDLASRMVVSQRTELNDLTQILGG
jgi:uncharacterized protein (DUF305 family)